MAHVNLSYGGKDDSEVANHYQKSSKEVKSKYEELFNQYKKHTPELRGEK